MSGAYKCLCNDCGRIAFFETALARQAAHAGETACVCGGFQLCSCKGCMDDAEYLLSGGRDQSKTIFLVSLDGWTPEGGLKA